jgi:hypothetical protein
MVTTIEYFVRAKNDKYSFRLRLMDNPDRWERQWEIVDLKGLPLPVLKNAKPADWTWMANPKAAGRTGTLWLLDEGMIFWGRIYLFNVPDDYLHGPFCKIADGTGIVTVSRFVDDHVMWKVFGPGCV